MLRAQESAASIGTRCPKRSIFEGREKMMKNRPAFCLRITALVVLALALSPTQAGSLEPVAVPSSDCCLVPGDVNHDGTFNISDLTYHVAYMFQGGPAPPCLAEADLNRDCVLDVADLTEWICWMFLDCSVFAECHNCP